MCYSTITLSGIMISLELPLMVPASALGGGARGRGLDDGGRGGKGAGLPGGKGGRNGLGGGARTGVRGALFRVVEGGTTTTDGTLGLFGQLGRRDVPDALDVEAVGGVGGVGGVAREWGAWAISWAILFRVPFNVSIS